MILLRQKSFSLIQKINESAAKREYNLNDPNERGAFIRRDLMRGGNAYSKEFKLKILKQDLEWLDSQEKIADKKGGWRGSERQKIKDEITRLEKSFSKSDKKKDDHTAEIAAGAAGLVGTAALGGSEYNKNVKPHKKSLKFLNNQIESSKDILDEINTEIRQKGGYDAVHFDRARYPISPRDSRKFNGKFSVAVYAPDNGLGQLERAYDSMARYDDFVWNARKGKRSARNLKKADKELNKAEKRAKKALEYFEKDKKIQEGLKNKGLRNVALIGAGGATLTAGAIAGVKAYKKKKAKKANHDSDNKK